MTEQTVMFGFPNRLSQRACITIMALGSYARIASIAISILGFIRTIDYNIVVHSTSHILRLFQISLR